MRLLALPDLLSFSPHLFTTTRTGASTTSPLLSGRCKSSTLLQLLPRSRSRSRLLLKNRRMIEKNRWTTLLTLTAAKGVIRHSIRSTTTTPTSQHLRLQLSLGQVAPFKLVSSTLSTEPGLENRSAHTPMPKT